jgi:hypothetical protein
MMSVIWEREAGQMRDIYQNAYLALAPTAARSSLDGFFSHCGLDMPFTVKKEDKIINSGVFYAQFPTAISRHDVIKNSTWKTRGWTF